MMVANLKHMALALLIWPVVLHAQTEQMLVVTVGSKPVAYHAVGHGAGTPVLLINGGPGFPHGILHASTAWESIAQGRAVVFFDQPGTGQSWPLGAGDSLAVSDVLASIEAIRQAIGAPRVTVLGHSFGGYLAMAYAIQFPKRVERVVLVDSVAPKVAATEFFFAALFPERMAAEKGLSPDNPADVQTWIRGRMAMSFYSADAHERYLAKLPTLPPMLYSGRQETLLWKDAEAHDLTDGLRRLAVPVLVTTGRFDANVSPRTAWRIHQAIPRSKFVVFERSGHFPMIEEPESFAAVVNGFLSGNK